MLTEEEKKDKKERDLILKKANMLDGTAERPPIMKDVLGLCFKCKNLQYACSQMGRIFAKCWTFEFNLKSEDPIKDCSSYEDRFHPDIRTMSQMATYIDLDGTPRQVGFMAEWEDDL